MRLAPELRQILLPDREGPERGDGIAPGRGLVKTWPRVIEAQN